MPYFKIPLINVMQVKGRESQASKGFLAIIVTLLFGVFGEGSAKKNRKICTWTEFNREAQNLLGARYLSLF